MRRRLALLVVKLVRAISGCRMCCLGCSGMRRKDCPLRPMALIHSAWELRGLNGRIAWQKISAFVMSICPSTETNGG